MVVTRGLCSQSLPALCCFAAFESTTAYESTTLHDSPSVTKLHNFLTKEECRELIEAGKRSGLQKSRIYEGEEEIRSSRSSWPPRFKTGWLLRRVSSTMGISSSHLETPQVTLYRPGDYYNVHVDTVLESNPSFKRAGQRVVTMLIYLTDHDQGGETCFPDLNLQIAPDAGSAIVFHPANGDEGEPAIVDQQLTHLASEIDEGEKWVCQIWIREKPWIFCWPVLENELHAWYFNRY